MASSYTTKTDLFPKMIQEIKNIDGTGVEVGVFKGENAWLAGIHEYGCDIPVTEKMRTYLHGRGLHLRKSTTHIHIPERAFLRTGYDTNRAEVTKKAAMLLADVASARMTALACSQAVGMELASRIKETAIGMEPANHPFTVASKGSSTPLVQTGDMISSIDWRACK